MGAVTSSKLTLFRSNSVAMCMTATTMRCSKFAESSYITASPAIECRQLQSSTGIGELNHSHLSRVFAFAAGCGLAGCEETGSNTAFVLKLVGLDSPQAVARRITPFLREARLLEAGETLSGEEAQMDLCVTLYVVQTLLIGNNGHHPRISEGSTEKATVALPLGSLKRFRDRAKAGKVQAGKLKPKPVPKRG